MGNERPLVSIVDDDESVREALPDLLRSFGYDTEAFASAQEFIASGRAARTSCLVLDIAMPDVTGPELFKDLRKLGYSIPTIFITAVRDESVRPRLLKQGAIDCLFKPFSEGALHQAVKAALQSAN